MPKPVSTDPPEDHEHRVKIRLASDHLREVGRSWEAAGMPQSGDLFDSLSRAREAFLALTAASSDKSHKGE